MALTFYTNPFSRGRTVRWMLEEVGEPYETRIVEYGPAMKSPEYRAIHPMGKVPALVHDGHVVTEVAGILGYLAEAFPAAGLMPADRAAFWRWMTFAAGSIEAAVLNHALAVEVPAEKQGMVGYGSLPAVLDVIRARTAESPFFCGEAFSVVDLFIGAQVSFGMMRGFIAPDPVLEAYWGRMKDRPALLRAQAVDNDLIAKAKAHA